MRSLIIVCILMFPAVAASRAVCADADEDLVRKHDALLRKIAERVFPSIPTQARIKHVLEVDKGDGRGGLGGRPEYTAWLLEDNASGARLFSAKGNEFVPAKEVTVSDSSYPAEAEFTLKMGQRFRQQARVKEIYFYEKRGSIRSFHYVPQVLVGIMSYLNTDYKSSASMLRPILDQDADGTQLDECMRDALGQNYYFQMTESFLVRDYSKTLALAQHLSGKPFDGYYYQDCAKKMARELPARMDDFKTHVLPAESTWKGMREQLSRSAQIVFLAKQLRLVNEPDLFDHGGSFESRQVANREDYQDYEHPKETIINPYLELRNMALTPADLIVLAPFLADESFAPLVSCRRTYEPNRTIQQVNWAVSALINDAAKTELTVMHAYNNNKSAYDSLDAIGKKAFIQRIVNWGAEHAGKSHDELARSTLENSTQWNEFEVVAKKAMESKIPGLTQILARRVGEVKCNNCSYSPDYQIGEWCFRMNDTPYLEIVRGWVRDGFPSSDLGHQFWVAMYLLRHGDHAKAEGAAELRVALGRRPHCPAIAVDPLLKLNDPAAVELASTVFNAEEPGSVIDAPILQRLLLAGRRECVDFMLKNLDNEKQMGTGGASWQGQAVERNWVVGDYVAESVAKMRNDNYAFSTGAPDDIRANARAALKPWLEEQFKLIKEGKPSKIKSDLIQIHFPNWEPGMP